MNLAGSFPRSTCAKGPMAEPLCPEIPHFTKPQTRRAKFTFAEDLVIVWEVAAVKAHFACRVERRRRRCMSSSQPWRRGATTIFERKEEIKLAARNKKEKEDGLGAFFKRAMRRRASAHEDSSDKKTREVEEDKPAPRKIGKTVTRRDMQDARFSTAATLVESLKRVPYSLEL